MVFSKNCFQNQFLLHFLIHTNVLMLCRNFELIPTNNLSLKNETIFEKLQCFISKNWLRNHPPIFIKFPDAY